MRIESAVTSISWIPSEAVQGMPKVPFTMGVAHYDDAPPDRRGRPSGVVQRWPGSIRAIAGLPA